MARLVDPTLCIRLGPGYGKHMRAASVSLCLVFLLALAAPTWASPPERAQGISMHMLPKRVADLGQRKWGFVVAYARTLKPEQEQPVLQTPQEVLAFVRKQDSSVQENGVWIVTTHPDAYSESEIQLLEDIKLLSRRERIPLFVARGSQLPDGWRRYDTAR